jgi:hypothetical protein
VESSSFRQRLTKLEADGFIEYGPESTVRANIQWFGGEMGRVTFHEVRLES